MLLSIAMSMLLVFACGSSDTPSKVAQQSSHFDSLMVHNTAFADTLHPVTFINVLQKNAALKVLDSTYFLFSGKDMQGEKFKIPAIKGDPLESIFKAFTRYGYTYVDGAEMACGGIKNYENKNYKVSLRFNKSACKTAVYVNFLLDIFVYKKE